MVSIKRLTTLSGHSRILLGNMYLTQKTIPLLVIHLREMVPNTTRKHIHMSTVAQPIMAKMGNNTDVSGRMDMVWYSHWNKTPFKNEEMNYCYTQHK